MSRRDDRCVDWGDNLPGYGWPFIRFAIVWTVLMMLFAYIGLR